ncbi:hypothetical protein GCM10028807_48500 [Spirosoma daeguense]
MESLKQVGSPPARIKNNADDSLLSLYDRYSSLAYGVILQIIPEQALAQKVLVDLFSSEEVKSYAQDPIAANGKLIRLARNKALEARPAHLIKTFAIDALTVSDDLGKLVFELSFYQGYSIPEIAEKLKLPSADVMKTLSTYFKQHRTSK